MRKENDNNLPKVRFYPQALVFFAVAGLVPLLALQAVAVLHGRAYGFAGFLVIISGCACILAFAWRRGALSGE